MISLTRLNGQRFAVNPDLIERAEPTPDTVVTLVGGAKLLVRESLDEVMDCVAEHRAAVVARAIDLANQPEGEAQVLTVRPKSRPYLTVPPEVD